MEKPERDAIARRIRAVFADGEGTEGLRAARAADLELERLTPILGSLRDVAAERRRGDEILRALTEDGRDHC